MNKRKQQIAQSGDVPKTQGFQPRTALPSKRLFLRLAWIFSLCLVAVGWTVLSLFSDRTTWIGSDGFLHEPLFGLIPISYFFLLVAIVLAVFDLVLKLRKRR